MLALIADGPLMHFSKEEKYTILIFLKKCKDKFFYEKKKTYLPFISQFLVRLKEQSK